MTLILFLFLSQTLIQVSASPELLQLSSRNECIKSVVNSFISSDTCSALSQSSKSELALRMTNCLFEQMGKSRIECKGKCQLQGDSWNTFTTFFAHIDNLCHFYWDVSKAERAQQMIDALMSSAKNTEETLSKNNQNTRQILQLQTSLKLQILNSIATQQQMSQIISNSSLTINSLTSQISASLNKIHADIDQHYAVVTRILSAVNQVLKHLDSLQLYLVAEVRSVQGVLFFVTLVIFTFIGCIFSVKVKLRKNECLLLICVHFLLEFFFSWTIHEYMGIQLMRCISILTIFIMIVSTKVPTNQFEHVLSVHLSSERMSRIMSKALHKEINNNSKQDKSSNLIVL